MAEEGGDEKKPQQANKKKKSGGGQPPPDIKPKPKLSKAERRALQEQQRAAKAARGGAGGAGAAKGGESKKQPPQQAAAKKAGSSPPDAAQHHGNKKQHEEKKSVRWSDSPPSSVPFLVSHLAPYQNPENLFETGAVLRHKQESTATTGTHNLHPAVIALGYEYATGSIRGGNARCRAMLDCYSQVLQDFCPSSENNNSDLRHVLDHEVLKPAFTFWTEHCRPHSVSMGNAFSFLKTAVASLDRDMSWETMNATLQETVAAYQKERIEFADKAIAEIACQKLLTSHDDDDEEEVFLTFGHSEAVAVILQTAAAASRRFRVIVVDSRPLQEGRQLLTQLRRHNIECSYVLLNGLTYVLQDVTKVLLGAAALMSDGSVTGRAGTAVTAMAAHSHNIPVLFCAETYKISNRVQLESITVNELGDPAAVVPPSPTMENNDTTNTTSSSSSSSSNRNLKTLNLLFDLTPAEFVSGIVTELGIVPPSSVAVLLREMNQSPAAASKSPSQ